MFFQGSRFSHGLLLPAVALEKTSGFIFHKLIIKIWRFGIFFPSKFDEFGPFFFKYNSFVSVEIAFLGSKFGVIPPEVFFLKKFLTERHILKILIAEILTNNSTVHPQV
jgi:hypothetical protein